MGAVPGRGSVGETRGVAALRWVAAGGGEGGERFMVKTKDELLAHLMQMAILLRL